MFLTMEFASGDAHSIATSDFEQEPATLTTGILWIQTALADHMLILGPLDPAGARVSLEGRDLQLSEFTKKT